MLCLGSLATDGTLLLLLPYRLCVQCVMFELCSMKLCSGCARLGCWMATASHGAYYCELVQTALCWKSLPSISFSVIRSIQCVSRLHLFSWQLLLSQATFNWWFIRLELLKELTVMPVPNERKRTDTDSHNWIPEQVEEDEIRLHHSAVLLSVSLYLCYIYITLQWNSVLPIS